MFDENGKLQSWVSGCDIGTQGSLSVTERHQQKGLASALSIKFGKLVADKYDMDLVWNTEHGNDAEHELAHRCNAANLGTVTWMTVNKRPPGLVSLMGMY